MLKLADIAKLNRPVRQDDLEQLGDSTAKQLVLAIEDGRLGDAKALAKYHVTEGKPLHDLFCDWIWDMLTRIANRHGEDEMVAILRETQEGWMMRRTWRGFLGLGVEQRVQLTAEIMRSHYCGPDQDGSITIRDEGDRFAIVMDPCGSGGRMRRGDPVDGTPSRLGSPYRFGTMREARPESWNRTGVPYYCSHCAMNEILPMEWGGHPLWVTDFDPDPVRPCVWAFYKRAEDIPDQYYTRVGRTRPAPDTGLY